MPALTSTKVRLKREWWNIPSHAERLLDRLPHGIPYPASSRLIWRAVLDPTAIALAEFHGLDRRPLLTVVALYESDQTNGTDAQLASRINDVSATTASYCNVSPTHAAPRYVELREQYGWPLKPICECLAIKNRDTRDRNVGTWLFHEMAHVLYKQGVSPSHPQFHYLSPCIFDPVSPPTYSLITETLSGNTITAVYQRHPDAHHS